jgi:hypothetical protein
VKWSVEGHIGLGQVNNESLGYQRIILRSLFGSSPKFSVE